MPLKKIMKGKDSKFKQLVRMNRLDETSIIETIDLKYNNLSQEMTTVRGDKQKHRDSCSNLREKLAVKFHFTQVETMKLIVMEN